MSKLKTQKPELIAFTLRGDNIETSHHGWICVVNQDKKIIYQKGDISNKIYLRSSEKPIQATPLIDNYIEITQKELALASGSHSGANYHLKILKDFLKKNKLHHSDLKCGVIFPFDEEERKKLIKGNNKPSSLHNNCSGKHIGMLSVCKNNEWNLKTYLEPNHPLQKSILKNIKYLSETNDISVGIDGCGAPTHSLPLVNIAKMFSNFTNPKNTKYFKIISAMSNNPLYIGGGNQVDTELIRISKGKIISKDGAEGIIIAAYNGNSAVIKIADGVQRIRSLVILELLIKLNWIKKSDLRNSVLGDIVKSELKNNSGKIVGKTVVKI